MDITSARNSKLIACFILLLFFLVAVSGMVNVTASSENESEDAEDSSASRGSRAIKTIIPNYIMMFDYGTPTNEHDGTFGDAGSDDSHSFFFLGTQITNFRVRLQNINEDGFDYRYFNTTLRTTSDSNNLITIDDGEYDRTNLWDGNNRDFFYDFTIGPSSSIRSTELAIDIDYQYIDANTVWQYRSATLYFQIILSTRIYGDGVGGTIRLYGEDQGGWTIPIYSGSKNMLVTIRDYGSQSGYLENLVFTLNLPTGFSLTSKTAASDDSWDVDPMWMLADAGGNDVQTNVFTGNFDVTYEYNDDSITEQGIPIEIEIVETPIVELNGQVTESGIGAKSGGKFVTNYELYQGSTSETFGLTFKNSGNIDLKDVEVELNRNNAAYFFNSQFYYDETWDASKQMYGNVIEFGDVGIGKSVTKSFSTEVFKNLPPGLYKIPISYTAKYNRGGFIDITIDEDDYHSDIISARASDNEGFDPFLLVEVKEGDDANDVNEPDLLAMSSTYLQKGMKNVKLRVEISNLENYGLNAVNAQIEAGGTTPLREIGTGNGSGSVDAIETDFFLSGANNPGSDSYMVTFPVDINRDALSGAHSVPITVTCLDPYNQQRTTLVYVTLNVNSIPPAFVVSDVSAEPIGSNDLFTLTVKVFNSGGSDAQNVRVLFNSSSNLFSAKESYQTKSEVRQNEEAEFIFVVMTGELDQGNFYDTSLFVSYEDEAGNLYPFSPHTEQPVTLRAKVIEEKEEEPTMVDTLESLSMMLLGIFILIGIIIFSFLQYRIAMKDELPKEKKGKGFGKKDKGAPPKQPSKLTPAPAPSPQQAQVTYQQTTALPPPPPPAPVPEQQAQQTYYQQPQQ
jgi:hypothetical protein